MSTRAFMGIENQIKGAFGVAALAAVMLAMLFFASPSAAAPAPSTSCTGENVTITSANAGLLQRSLQCIINVYRYENGRSPLTRDATLEQAARNHSFDMVNRGYFDHVSPEGTEHDDRALAAGYPANEVDTGENLAASDPATPFLLFEEWRTSPPCSTGLNPCGHNENMLTAKWVVGGFGIAPGWPDSSPSSPESATVTGLFGAQNRGGTDYATELVDGDPNAVPGPPADDGGGPGGGPGGGTACDSEQAGLNAAEVAFAKAKAAKAKAAARKRKARGFNARRKAKRKLKAKRKALSRARSQKAQAQERYADCRSGL